MIGVNELRKGVTFTMDGELYKVLAYQHHKPGRGKATIRTTLRNLRTGATIQQNFISGDRVEDVRVERRGVQYLYTDGDLYHFMDTETYEQTALAASALGDQVHYLKESMEVVEAEMAIAGDTATGAMKKVRLETGLEVQVPLFIEQGDVIRVDTRTGEYVTRM
jgi:elongation factor P